MKRTFATICIAAALACGGPSPDDAPSPPTELPPGHPPLGDEPAPGTVMPPPPGTGTGETGLTWDAPATWVSEPPGNPMRRAQYRAGADAAGECVVYYFGPGQGGDAESNARMWADQFAEPGTMKTEEIDVNGIRVTLVEVTGTYSGGLADHMLLGAVAEGPDANWFFKFTGPEDVLRDEAEAFEAMIRSLRRGG